MPSAAFDSVVVLSSSAASVDMAPTTNPVLPRTALVAAITFPPSSGALAAKRPMDLTTVSLWNESELAASRAGPSSSFSSVTAPVT